MLRIFPNGMDSNLSGIARKLVLLYFTWEVGQQAADFNELFDMFDVWQVLFRPTPKISFKNGIQQSVKKLFQFRQTSYFSPFLSLLYKKNISWLDSTVLFLQDILSNISNIYI